MRTISTDQEAVLDGQARTEYLKIEIADSGGVFRDMSSYPGFNAVDSASWSENIDDPGATASVTLKREFENFSLSPFMESSAANRGFNPAASYAPLISIWREIKISVAVMPDGISPSGSDYTLFFHGYIDTIDTAASDSITLECRDKAAKLIDRYIERERVHAFSSASIGMRIWEKNVTADTDEYFIPTQNKLNGHYYKVTNDGTTGTIEPGDPASGGDPGGSWPTAGAGTVTSGTGGTQVTFTEDGSTSTTARSVESVMQAILDANGLSAITLYTPSSPSWTITWFKQQRQSVMDALRALANQIGWDVRYKWRSGSSAFELQLIGPTRTSPSVDRTFNSSDYSDIRQLSLDVSGIRNVVRVVYSDPTDLHPNGTPKRKAYEASDSTSITDFGRRFMEVAESSASNIDSSGEAQTMADAILADLKDPVFDKEVELAYGFPWVELNDYYTFSANGRHYDTDQSLAVVSFSHEFSDGRMRTTIQCRGLPAGGYRRWHEISTRNQPSDLHQTTLMLGSAAPTVATAPVVGGQRISLTLNPDKRVQDAIEWEYHVSTTSGFTPSSSSLLTVTKSTEVIAPHLVPGTTYYTKLVPVMRNAGRMVRGEATAQSSFTAARAYAGHIDSESGIMMPPNGSFENSFDSNAPPDHWNVISGTWGTNISLLQDSSGVEGRSYLKFHSANGTSQDLQSNQFPVEPGARYEVTAWTKYVSGTGTASFSIYELDKDGSIVGSSALEIVNSTVSTAGTWQYVGNYRTTHADARFAVIRLFKSIDGTIEWHCGAVLMKKTRWQPANDYDESLPATDTTTSSSFSSVSGISFTFNQRMPNQEVVVIFCGSLFAQTDTAIAEYRVKFVRGSTTVYTPAFPVSLSEILEHQQWSFACTITGGLDRYIGAWTVTLEWRRSAGSGTLSTNDQDSASVVVF